MKTTLMMLACCTLSALSAFGQNASSGSVSPSGFGASATFGPPPPYGIRPVLGAPYSGEEFSEIVRTLADGTHITRTTPHVKVYRDSQGRTRTERPMGPEGLMIVEILDPVAHAKYILDPQHKVAHRQELPAVPPEMVLAGAARRGAMAASTSSAGGGGGGGSRWPIRARPQMATEKLGTRMIEGVLVEGTRHTTTWPVGTLGNDRPIAVTGETWMSPELQVVILGTGNDPSNGEQTHKLINLSRSEPDPSLFQPPPGYAIVDEKSEFTINWNSQ